MKKINPILQMNQTECGLCAALMLMEYYNVKLNISDVSSEYMPGRDGLSIGALREIFTAYNFDSYIYEVKDYLSQIRNSALPCILFKELGHFVVAESINADSINILDPEIGRINVSKDLLDKEYKNIVIKISPNKDFKEINKRGSEFSLVWEAFAHSKREMLKVLATTVLVYTITMLTPILVQQLVNIFIKSNYLTNQVRILSISIVISSLVYAVVNKIKLIGSVNLSISVDRFLTNKVINKLFNNKFEYFLTRTSSDIQYRLIILKSLKNLISNVLIQTILDLGTMILIFVYMVNINVRYALFLLSFTLIMIFFSLIIKNRMLALKNKELLADNKLQILQYDIFRSIFDVKVLALSDVKKKTWMNDYSDFLNANRANQLFISNYHNLLAYITLYVPIFVSLLGIWIAGLTNTSELGTIISLQSMAGIYINGLISISQLSDNITSMKSYIMRIQDVLIQEDEEVRTKKISFKGNMNIENVSFKYPGAKNSVLKNITLSIKEGESVAIVGKSGSGKSTLFYILLGAYDKYQGKIKYENIDLELINKDNLRRQIGVVPQNPLLFNGSIRDNLSSDKHFDDKQLYDVLKKVALLDFIKSLPMGIDTIVSENGFNLSGGQKQRLALARAILDKKTVLFLDEATSSLDNITEREVVNHLDRDAETKVVIAHRLSTIKKSDKIIVMKDGMISEVGTHYELMSKKGEYYKMYIDEDSQYT
ncbi:peptidase domain-containing ABC transporter [Ligilactobacillus animalis]|jgi:ATP-binding cassette subfamily B protein|uniref:peptidase domain-containing ABC transporter n=1 Tax=Ligilactobacillus animalis TaxID=1605 RepID=UPI003510F573